MINEIELSSNSFSYIVPAWILPLITNPNTNPLKSFWWIQKLMEYIKTKKEIKYYSPVEEKINIISHEAGFILSIVALVFLVAQANLRGDVWHVVSFSIFGTSLIIVYAALNK